LTTEYSEQSLSKHLAEIAEKASKCKRVSDVDDCIQEYRDILGGRDDQHDTLKMIFKYRNSLVQLNNQPQNQY